MKETYNLKGKKYRVRSATEEGLELVKNRYPDANLEGSLAHYTYLSLDRIIAEAWPHRNQKEWWLRFKE